MNRKSGVSLAIAIAALAAAASIFGVQASRAAIALEVENLGSQLAMPSSHAICVDDLFPH